MTKFIDHNGDEMVPLVCELCGTQIGVRSPGPAPNPDLVIARCNSCAVVEEAEEIVNESRAP